MKWGKIDNNGMTYWESFVAPRVKVIVFKHGNRWMRTHAFECWKTIPKKDHIMFSINIKTREQAFKVVEKYFEGEDFEGANLEEATFSCTTLEGANLKGANLKGANFSCADLKETTLNALTLQGKTFQVNTSQGKTFQAHTLREDYPWM